MTTRAEQAARVAVCMHDGCPVCTGCADAVREALLDLLRSDECRAWVADRSGCCAGDRRPCAYHEGREDALDLAAAYLLTEQVEP